MPIYRVTVVSRTTMAINYNHRQGSTNIAFRGTALMPEARVVDMVGEWTLFESTLPVVPLTSPPRSPPAICATDTLGSRLLAAGRAARARAAASAP